MNIKTLIIISGAYVSLMGGMLAYGNVGDKAYTIEVIERHLYGPGPFPDQKLKAAWIRNLKLDSFLTGEVKGSNNRGDEPNVSGEILQGKIIDGMLSDKTLINEDIDMSNAVIMNGQFNLLLAAVFGGPNKGDTFFYHDDNYNWWIKDDIAIDPGFPAGIVKIDDFTFTTGPRVIPNSIQTESGYPGGTNKTGSLEAGRVALGRLGDENEDGLLDGIFNAIGRFPMESIFLPGAPFVQLFEFKSDIPISPLDAALLSLGSSRSYLSVLDEVQKKDENHVDIPVIRERLGSALQKAASHLKRSKTSDACANCGAIDEMLSLLAEGAKAPERAQIKKIFITILDIHRKKNG